MKLDIFIGTFLDTDGKEHHVEIRLPKEAGTMSVAYNQPLARFLGPPVYEYRVSTILEVARHRRELRVHNGFDDDIGTFSIRADEIQRLAGELEKAVPGAVGQFRVTWEPSDPALPF